MMKPHYAHMPTHMRALHVPLLHKHAALAFKHIFLRTVTLATPTQAHSFSPHTDTHASLHLHPCNTHSHIHLQPYTHMHFYTP